MCRMINCPSEICVADAQRAIRWRAPGVVGSLRLLRLRILGREALLGTNVSSLVEKLLDLALDAVFVPCRALSCGLRGLPQPILALAR